MNTEPQPPNPERLEGYSEARELVTGDLAELQIARALWMSDGHTEEGPESPELREEYARQADIVIGALLDLLGDPEEEEYDETDV